MEQVVRVNGVPFQIVGVAPPQFRGLIAGQVPKVYLPVSTFADVNPGRHGYDDWALRWLNAFMRIPGNASRTAAEAELQRVYRAAVGQQLAREVPEPDEYVKEPPYEHMSIVPASQGVHAVLHEWPSRWRILQWTTLAVLFLATINVAGLMLVRGVREKQETLIRYAIGATRSAVTRLHFLETSILAPDSAEIHAALGQLLIASGRNVHGQQVSNLTDLSGAERPKIRQLLKKTISLLTEAKITSVQATEDSLYEGLGLVDAAIAVVAGEHKCTVLTDDFDLYLMLQRDKLEAVNFTHLRARILET